MIHDVEPPAHPIVGIGASAGGLEALETLVSNLDPGIPAPVVVLQHLSPDYESLMPELLGRRTRIPVQSIQHGEPCQPGRIYVLPPRSDLIVARGRFVLSERLDLRGPNLPIDLFFRSLAEECGDRSIGVVLSGTGSDGAKGVAAIREAGGRVLVQDPTSARFDGMPLAALAVGTDIEALPTEQLAQRIAELVRDSGNAADDPQQVDNDPMQRILATLMRERGVDFRLYKQGTVQRRTLRRVSASGDDDLERYALRIERDAVEREALFREILVSVTEFFRDREAFDSLRRNALPDLLREAVTRGSLRVWCVGCATGEEAYSLAILVHEALRDLELSIDYKIFATDVDPRAIASAAEGRFPKSSAEVLGADRVATWFDEESDALVVRREIRDRIVFALHDVTRDPPFTRIDLLTCRNLLIYLQPQQQARVLNLLHFALAPRGLLLLGPSELPSQEVVAEFQDVDRKWHLYRKRRDVRLADADILSGLGARLEDVGSRTVGRPGPRIDEQMRTLEQLANVLLKHAGDCALLVTADRAVDHIIGDATPYLRIPEGRADTDVLRMVATDVRTPLSIALGHALRGGEESVLRDVRFSFGDSRTVAEVRVLPLAASTPARHDRRGVVVLFAGSILPNDLGQPTTPTGDDGTRAGPPVVRALESELALARQSLHATVEQLETANEELQSTNEELLASNEELQSTNEELHSVNEELFTVNAEHQAKIDELVELSNDVENLMRATRIGVIFLDENLHIRKFTPAVTRTIALVDHDVGRPLDHLAHGLVDCDLVGIARHVLATGHQLEREVATRDGGSFLFRALPYTEGYDRIGGVVLTLVDIREVKSAQRSLARSEARFRELVENIAETFWIRTADCREILYLSPQFGRVFGFPPTDILDDPNVLFEVVHPDDRDALTRYLREELPSGQQSELVYRIRGTGDDAMRWIHSRGYPIHDDHGALLRIVGFAADVTSSKRQESALLQLTRELEDRANHDPLTGLLNRRGLDGVLGREIDRALRSGTRVIAVMIDLDDFKRVNDSLGHSAGDVVLQGIAHRMQESLRPHDVLARVGGDEFLALLPDIRMAEAMQVAERLRLAISDCPIRTSDRALHVSASLGVAAVPEDAVAVDEVLGQTRHALAHGKGSGKNQVVAAEEAPGPRPTLRTATSGDDVLEQVLAGRGVRALCHEIRDIETDAVVGYEMLARGPEGTYYGPESLFRLSIERNVLGLVDLQCFKACVQAARGLPSERIHLNLYPSTLIDTPADRLLAMLDEAGGAERFRVEISEQQFLGDPTYLEEPIRRLRDAGVRIGIDDVGFGRSSLESLILLEPDVIKIDRSFVHGIDASAGKLRNLSRLIQVARHLAGELVVEGVESAGQLEVLRSLSVRYAQGFLWGEPRPPSDAALGTETASGRPEA